MEVRAKIRPFQNPEPVREYRQSFDRRDHVINFNVDFVAPSGVIACQALWLDLERHHSHDRISTDDLSSVQTIQVEIPPELGDPKSYWTEPDGVRRLPKPGSPHHRNPWFYTIPSIALASGNIYYLRTH